MLRSNSFKQILKILKEHQASSSVCSSSLSASQPAEPSRQTRFEKIHLTLNTSRVSAAVPFVPRCLLHGQRGTFAGWCVANRTCLCQNAAGCNRIREPGRQNLAQRPLALLQSTEAQKKAQRRQRRKWQSGRKMGPTSVSGAKIAVLEKCEKHGAG